MDVLETLAKEANSHIDDGIPNDSTEGNPNKTLLNYLRNDRTK